MPGRFSQLITPSSSALETSRAQRYRKRAVYLLKIGITLFILWRISVQIDIGAAVANIFALPASLAVLILLLSGIRHVLQYLNWYFALHLNPGYLPRKQEILASYFIALPLRFVLPGGHASFGKIFYVRNTSLLASLSATMAERSVMTWATWSFAAIALLYYYPDLNRFVAIAALIVALLLPLFAGIIMYLRQSWKPFLAAYIKQAPRMMSLQVLASGIAFIQYWLILNHIGMLSFFQSWLRIALTNFSNSIPITIAGLGLREGFAIHFLAPAGFSAEQAVSATLTLFFFQDIIPALIGAIVLLKTSRISNAAKHSARGITDL